MAPALRRAPACAQSHRAALRGGRAGGASRTPLCAGFAYGALNTNACPPGTSKIILESACADAAAAVGYVGYVEGMSIASYPSGCLYGGGKVFFNRAIINTPNPTVQPLCVGAPLT
jgi:hypothetical protein